MNVFRSRKKSIAEADVERPPLDKAPPVPAASRGRTIFRRKQQVEPKKELDLATALPSSDDFRTSLLMPAFSARFSMLREADDPNSKLGKAVDDSVLFPKRTSKLDLFGHTGLSDIAEVSSINGSVRPPFATEDNGYATDDDGQVGSIMSRAKPGQGNKFFGGRQKVYMIPQDGAGSTRDLNAHDRLVGKPVYEDDIHLSVFQALRAKEKAARKYSEDDGDYFDDRDDRSSKEHERDGKRTTSSSTNSNLREGRVSTAATSIASQFGTKSSPVTTPGQERAGQKKRLYGQGLDQQIHEQQSSAMNRLNSIQRGPVLRSGSAGPAASRSATNLGDRFRSSSPFSPAMRSGSPSPVTAFGGFDFGHPGQTRSSSRDADGVKQTPPMSPSTASPVDPTLVAALEPNDLGKATASGAFNKPKTPFSEQQFAQRQRQLQEQEGRTTPSFRSMSRAESSSDHSARLRNGSFASVRSGQSSRPYMAESSRAPSNASSHRPGPLHAENSQTMNGAFLADLSGSEYDSSPNSPDQLARRSPTEDSRDGGSSRKTSDEQRRRPMPIDSRTQVKSFMDPTAGTPISSPDAANENEDSAQTQVEPTASGRAGAPAGLNDLIRGHLRSDSGASSIYPASPTLPPLGFLQTPSERREAQAREESSVQQSMSEHARQVLERANQLTKAQSKAHDVLGGVREDKVHQLLGAEAPRRSHESNRIAWQEQLKSGHNRGASTETQKEREDFANELAERRRAVQDNLMRMEETAQPDSPSRGEDGSPIKNGPFGLLKKTSRGSLPNGNDNPTKAMKMLGMSSSTSNRQSPVEHSSAGGANGTARGPPQPYTADGRPKATAGDGPSFRERSIGAERRERFFRKGPRPPQAQAFQQPNAQAPLPPSNFGFSRPNGTAEQPMSYHPAGRARKYSPPSTKPPMPPAVPVQPPANRIKTSPDRPAPVTRPQAPPSSYFAPQTPESPNAHFSANAGDNPRPSPPIPAYSANTTPPIEGSPHAMTSANAAAMPVHYQSRNRSRAQSVSKHDISEPTFVSGSSSVSTVNLPPGASLQNGMNEVRSTAPPVPPINPNRRRGRVEMTQNVFTAFGGRSPMSSSVPNSAHPDNLPSPYEERSTFSGEEDEPKNHQRPRARLRKTSSENGSMAAKARHQALMREAEHSPPSPNGIHSRSRKNSESRLF